VDGSPARMDYSASICKVTEEGGTRLAAVTRFKMSPCSRAAARPRTKYKPSIRQGQTSHGHPNGSVATASSTYSSAYAASATINGDRKGTGWGEVGGGWNDATANSYPDWLQVTFNGSKTIDEIDVFTLQDNFSNPSEPTESMTFTQYGVVDFQVQYWNGLGWQTVSGGSISGNNKVWKKINFSQITTTKIRVNVTSALASNSRITEVEAWGPGPGTNYSYDAAGNVTNDGSHTYTYDAATRVVSVDGGGTAQYAYDYQNQRVKAVAGGATTHYVWEGGYVIAEHDGAAAGQWTTKVEYIYVPENVDWTVPGRVSWIDTPGLPRRDVASGDPISDADITWTFVFNLVRGGTSCSAFLELHLVVTNGRATWTSS
jgi:hypothetical protein